MSLGRWMQRRLAGDPLHFWQWGQSLFLLLPLVFALFGFSGSVRNFQYVAALFLLHAYWKQTPAPGTAPRVVLEAETRKTTVLILCCLILFACSSVLKLLAFDVNGIDFSIFQEMLLPQPGKSAGYASIVRLQHLGIHPSFTLFLFQPLVSLVPDPWVLQAIGGSLLAIAGFPLARLLRLYGVKEHMVWLVIWSFLGSSFVQTVVNGNFRLEQLLPFLIFSFLVAWKQERVFASLVWVLLLLLTKEDSGLYLAAFFVWESFKGQTSRLRNIARGGLFGGLGVTAFLILLVQPWFLEDSIRQPGYLKFWRHYGGDLQQILLGMLNNPLRVLVDILNSGFWRLFAILGFLPLLFSGGYSFALLPGIFILGTAASYPAMHGYGHYYPLVLASLAWAGFGPVLAKFQSSSAKTRLVIVLLTLAPCFHAGALKIFQPNWVALEESRQIHAYFEEQTGESEPYPISGCIQEILYPHFRLTDSERLDDRCLKREAPYLLIATGLDSFPHASEQTFSRWTRDYEKILGGQFLHLWKKK